MLVAAVVRVSDPTGGAVASDAMWLARGRSYITLGNSDIASSRSKVNDFFQHSN